METKPVTVASMAKMQPGLDYRWSPSAISPAPLHHDTVCAKVRRKWQVMKSTAPPDRRSDRDRILSHMNLAVGAFISLDRILTTETKSLA